MPHARDRGLTEVRVVMDSQTYAALERMAHEAGFRTVPDSLHWLSRHLVEWQPQEAGRMLSAAIRMRDRVQRRARREALVRMDAYLRPPTQGRASGD